MTAPGRAWLLLCALLGVGALGGAALAPPGLLDWQPGRWSREPWRLWSAAFVHWGALHLGGNLLGLMAVALYGAAARLPARFTAAWLAAWPLSHALLPWQEGLRHYGGLSGVLHAGVGVASVALLGTPGRPRAVGAAVLAGLGLKLLLESPGATAAGFGLATTAHAGGALAGVLCALAAAAGRRG